MYTDDANNIQWNIIYEGDMTLCDKEVEQNISLVQSIIHNYYRLDNSSPNHYNHRLESYAPL